MHDRGTMFFRRMKSFAKRSWKVGAVVVVGVVAYNCNDWNLTRKVVHASWTTSYEPSVKWDVNWDRREPTSLVEPPKNQCEDVVQEYKKKLKEVTPTASRHLLLIRHGQYFDNANVDKERFLTSLGRNQAASTGERLKLLDLPYTKFVCSTMTRAEETANIIHEYLPDLELVKDDCLREGAPIPPEPASGSWRPEAKQFFQDGARIESAFRKYFFRADVSQKDDSYEIIVCHANVIRFFICRALQVNPEAWLRFSLAHASITHFVIRPTGRLSVHSVGDHGHIPRDKISFV